MFSDSINTFLIENKIALRKNRRVFFQPNTNKYYIMR